VRAKCTDISEVIHNVQIFMRSSSGHDGARCGYPWVVVEQSADVRGLTIEKSVDLCFWAGTS
jgi:hypothetical protein